MKRPGKVTGTGTRPGRYSTPGASAALPSICARFCADARFVRCAQVLRSVTIGRRPFKPLTIKIDQAGKATRSPALSYGNTTLRSQMTRSVESTMAVAAATAWQAENSWGGRRGDERDQTTVPSRARGAPTRALGAGRSLRASIRGDELRVGRHGLDTLPHRGA